MRATCTATAPEAVRTFRTYATARTYSFSTPNSTPPRTNPQVTASPTQKRADHVLSRVGDVGVVGTVTKEFADELRKGSEVGARARSEVWRRMVCGHGVDGVEDPYLALLGHPAEVGHRVGEVGEATMGDGQVLALTSDILLSTQV